MPAKRIILAVDDVAFRERLVRNASGGVLPLHVLNSSADVLQMEFSEGEDVVMLETNDDVALLVQLVYELYNRSCTVGVPVIMAMASQSVYDDNRSLSPWLIDGHAAIGGFNSKEDFEREDLRRMARKLSELP